MGNFLKAVIVIGLCLWGIVSCENSDWKREADRQDEIQQLAAAIPHVVSVADGCSVYEFRRNDMDHFFTRCTSTTTTDSPHTEYCGKNCTKTVIETIPTTNK